jgi:stage V sporulation protein R
MLGIEYLWGAPVHLETSEIVSSKQGGNSQSKREGEFNNKDLKWKNVIYTMENRKLSKRDAS